MKRTIIILIILGSVIGLTVLGYQYAAPDSEPVSPADDPTVEIVEVERETLVDVVNATGSIEPSAEVELNFERSGVVDEVFIKQGQNVTVGTLLARLETRDLELAIKQAQIELAQAELDLEELYETASDEEIAASRAKVESARLDLAELIDDPDKEDQLTKAAADLRLKEVTLKKAQWDYDQVAYRGDIAAMGQADALQEATLSYETALADYNIAVRDLEATGAEVAQARSTLLQSEADLANLLEGPTQTEAAKQQATIELRKIAVEEAVRSLEEADLVSPTEGVILDVTIEPGERVLQDAQGAALVIADTSAYLLKVEVDEIDIGRIKQGQPTTIIVDAFVEEELSGEVIDISPRPLAQEGNSIVTYEVTVAIDTDQSNPGLLSGMTATANIETRRLEEAVVIPNRAIQTERGPDGATLFVEKLDEEGNPVRVEIEIGLRDGSTTEVLAGLEAGDQILIRSLPDTFGPSPDL